MSEPFVLTINGKRINTREDLLTLPDGAQIQVQEFLNHILYKASGGKEGVYSERFEVKDE